MDSGVAFFFKKRGYSCFTVLCQFLLYSRVSQPHVCLSFFLDLLPIEVTTEHLVEAPVLHSRFSLVSSFMHCSACMSVPVSQCIPTLHRSFFVFNQSQNRVLAFVLLCYLYVGAKEIVSQPTTAVNYWCIWTDTLYIDIKGSIFYLF